MAVLEILSIVCIELLPMTETESLAGSPVCYWLDIEDEIGCAEKVISDVLSETERQVLVEPWEEESKQLEHLVGELIKDDVTETSPQLIESNSTEQQDSRLCLACNKYFHDDKHHNVCSTCRRKMGRGELKRQSTHLGRPLMPLDELTNEEYRKTRIKRNLQYLEDKEVATLHQITTNSRDFYNLRTLRATSKEPHPPKELLGRFCNLLGFMKYSHEASIYLPFILHDLNDEDFEVVAKELSGKYSKGYLRKLKNAGGNEDYYQGRVMDHIRPPIRQPDEHYTVAVQRLRSWILDYCHARPGKRNSTIVIKGEYGIKKPTVVHWRVEPLRRLFEQFQKDNPDITYGFSWFCAHM